MQWPRESSPRAEAAPGPLARRFSGALASESPSSSDTSLSPHLKRSALDDSEQERREPVIVSLRVAHDPPHRRRVVVLDAAAERERQQVLRQRAREELGTAQQGVFESVDASMLRGAGQGAQRVNRLSVHIDVSPLPNRIEVLEREAHRIDAAMTAGADGVGAMGGQALAHRKIGGHAAL